MRIEQPESPVIDYPLISLLQHVYLSYPVGRHGRPLWPSPVLALGEMQVYGALPGQSNYRGFEVRERSSPKSMLSLNWRENRKLKQAFSARLQPFFAE